MPDAIAPPTVVLKFSEPGVYALNIPIWTHGDVALPQIGAVVSQKQHSQALRCETKAHLISSGFVH
jgi:hypothetical protein